VRSLESPSKLKKELDSAEEIQLSVVGRKSGKKIPRPVWFVHDGDKLLLLPGSGSKTEWYKNVLKNPNIEISVEKDVYRLRAQPVSDTKRIKQIVEKFKEKYGVDDVKKYYPENFDAAIEVSLA
jgi:deazaflavin-dependent oxidoreductase (nitroreductase family)